MKQYLINPVENREASLEKPDTLISAVEEPEPVFYLDGFVNADDSQLDARLGDHTDQAMLPLQKWYVLQQSPVILLCTAHRTAVRKDIAQAIANAYQGVEKIKFENMQYRTDIGKKAFL